MTRRASEYRDIALRALARGALIEDIAEEYGIHPGTVRDWNRRNGTARHRSNPDIPTVDQTVALFRLMRTGIPLEPARISLGMGQVRAENCLGAIYLACARAARGASHAR